MKKLAILLAGAVLCVGLSGCTELEDLRTENAELSSKVTLLEQQLEQAEEKLYATPTPAPTPTPTPKPTATPTPTPSPTPTPEPEMTEEEFKASCTAGYDYKELARDPKTYIGKPAQFRGEVAQVMESDGINVYRINVTEGRYSWDDTIYVYYIPSEDEKRILEDDIVTVYGTMTDLVTYETVIGGSVTIPGMYAKYIELS